MIQKIFGALEPLGKFFAYRLLDNPLPGKPDQRIRLRDLNVAQHRIGRGNAPRCRMSQHQSWNGKSLSVLTTPEIKWFLRVLIARFKVCFDPTRGQGYCVFCPIHKRLPLVVFLFPSWLHVGIR